MNALLVLVGLGLASAVVAIVASRQRGGGKDLGAVSHQWISEHRLGQTHD